MKFTAMGGKARLRLWLKIERNSYSNVKWHRENHDLHVQTVADGGWSNFIHSYLKRAEGMTLQTVQGRQQLGKLIAAATDILETAIEQHGDMPRPGRSSTDPIVPWGLTDTKEQDADT